MAKTVKSPKDIKRKTVNQNTRHSPGFNGTNPNGRKLNIPKALKEQGKKSGKGLDDCSLDIMTLE